MPTLVAANQTVRFSDSPMFQFGPSYPVSSLSSTGFRVNWDGAPFSYQASGTGLADTNADGRPDVGTVASIAVYTNGALLFTITGINRTIADLDANAGALLDSLLAGNDTINGSSVDDYFSPFAGSDTFQMGAGNDSFINYGGVESGVTLQVFGGAGNDTIIQGFSATSATTTLVLDGGSGADRIETSLYSYEHLDLTINGGDNDDLIIVMPGAPGPYNAVSTVISGGGGFDTLRLGFYSTLLDEFLTSAQFWESNAST